MDSARWSFIGSFLDCNERGYTASVLRRAMGKSLQSSKYQRREHEGTNIQRVHARCAASLGQAHDSADARGTEASDPVSPLLVLAERIANFDRLERHSARV